MTSTPRPRPAPEPEPHGLHVAFIGSAGVPNRYGGFEAFLEHCVPAFVARGVEVKVTCDARLYPDRTSDFAGAERIFIPVPANGAASVIHDLVAFLRVWRGSTHVVVLGVSGGPWFPLFRLLCAIGGQRLLVNVDGVEWRRTKFTPSRRALLKLFDRVAQRCAGRVIIDNGALRPYLVRGIDEKVREIGYPGDHVLRRSDTPVVRGSVLTIARIEPENSIDLLLRGVLACERVVRYTVIGNWQASAYGRELRARWSGEPRANLLDPVYDTREIAGHREGCDVYVHGHSVGGTNPSLVEMLFYDCRILCLDVPFHHVTARGSADYFRDEAELTVRLRHAVSRPLTADEIAQRRRLRQAMTREAIARSYLAAMTD